MVNSLPAVVIDNGSSTTRAGFASDEIPSLVYNSVYQRDDQGNVIVGDENVNSHPDLDVMTLVKDGLIYDYENIASNWQYAYDSLDNGNGVDPKDHPLVMTEETWNTTKNKTAMAQLAFEQFNVPLFSLVKSPLAQLYHAGRLSGLVIDVGASKVSVTPILDGIIQQKSTFHSKYGGDFVTLHAMRSLEAKLGHQPAQLDFARLIPSKYASGTVLDSFKAYHATHNLLHNFKQTMLYVTEPPPGVPPQSSYYLGPPHQHPSAYQLPDKTLVSYKDNEIIPLTEPLFVPHSYKLPGVPVPDPSFEKPHTHGLLNIVLFTIKSLELSFMSSVANESQSLSANARFNDVMRQLFQNFLLTGGGSLLPGLSDRLCGDLGRSAPQVLPNYAITGTYKLYITPLRNHAAGDIHDVFEKRFGAWLGASTLANMLNMSTEGDNGSVNVALDNWFISKADYEELGEDYIVEKYK